MPVIQNTNDPRVIRTKKLLMDSFREIGMEKSLDKISVKDITERATVNRATFYAHFIDKYDILDAIIYEEFCKLVTNNLEIHHHTFQDNLKSLIAIMCQYHVTVEKCNIKVWYISMSAYSKIQDELRDIIMRMMEEDESILIPEKEREILAMFVCSALYGGTENISEMEHDREELCEKLVGFILDGIHKF